MMDLSYWEYKTWLSNVDFTIVGSGIVGLSCALHLRERFPKAKILVLEKGLLPEGASTKNAGFACFGSLSEILADMDRHGPEEVRRLVSRRWEGIQLLRRLVGDTKLGYQRQGGHELFLEGASQSFEECLERRNEVNVLLASVFGGHPFKVVEGTMGFKGVRKHYISCPYEAQIDTGAMMRHLIEKVQSEGILLYNGVRVTGYRTEGHRVHIETDRFVMESARLMIATNGFALGLLQEDVRPGRAQVLVTDPIPKLSLTGNFHLEEGYYYFREIDGRVLLGGGRNLDFKAEETDGMGLTSLVQNRLEQLLREVILPDVPHQIERRWSGIMGIGPSKKPIVKEVEDRVYCGVRLGGMGIAIGSSVGKDLANLV